MVKLKLLDATRKAVLEKAKKPTTSTAMQTDTIKTKLCKDQLIDNQNDLLKPTDQETETDIELVALKSKDGVSKLKRDQKMISKVLKLPQKPLFFLPQP